MEARAQRPSTPSRRCGERVPDPLSSPRWGLAWEPQEHPAWWGVSSFCPVPGGWPLSTPERERRTRVNRMIRISPVRVISDSGEQLGVLPIEEALAAAEERGLDLVEVAPTARPPVVKIMDYGKFKFEEAKAARAAKKKQHVIDIKEVKFRPSIDEHDFEFKTRHMREFLLEGNKVKVTMMFRGRQMARLALGKAGLDRGAPAVADIGKIEVDARLAGKERTLGVA